MENGPYFGPRRASFEHLRQIVQLRKASGHLGLLIMLCMLGFVQLHISDPALFRAADHHAERTMLPGHQGSASGQAPDALIPAHGHTRVGA